MIVGEARISANRRNAALSTGPKTEEGKERSRRDALKHGLTGAGVVRGYGVPWTPTYHPGSDESGR